MKARKPMKLALVFGLVIFIFCSSINTYAQEVTGTISGTVYDVTGQPITGQAVSLTAWSEEGDVFGQTCTDPATGQYTITNLPLDIPMFAYAGDNDCGYNGYGREYWQETPDFFSATDITLTSSMPNISGIDFTLDKFPDIEIFYFNFDTPILDDLAVRQAIAYGTDRQSILNKAWLPNDQYGMVQNSYINNNFWAKAPDSVLTLYPYDPTQAQDILDTAGWVDTNEDGIREKNGQPLSLRFTTRDEPIQMITGQLFQQMMANIGIEIQLQFIPGNIFFSPAGPRATHDFDIMDGSPGYCGDSQDETCVPYASFNTGHPYNFGSYNSPEAEAEYQAAQTAITREERLPHAIQHQVIISRDLPILPLFTHDLVTPVDTPTGDNVSVTPIPGVTIYFDTIGQGGVTTTIVTDANPADLPSYFQLLGTIYDVGTTVEFPNARACFNYDDTDLSLEQESQLRLYHQESGVWVDVTESGYPDTVNNEVCGIVSSFSPFAILLPVNRPPSNVVINTPPDPQLIGTSIQASASFSDLDIGDTHTALWNWGDGISDLLPVNGLISTASHAFNMPGVYTVTVTITDKAGDTASAISQYLVIYDPNGGFVTGGGWINSPMGAYTTDPTLSGKATFGFVSKYQKGANVPTGNTKFKFKVADLNFKSTSYDWLVTAGTKAMYKGTGTINGAGEYGFMLSAIDGTPDKYRIKIWDKATGMVVYDNQLAAADSADPITAIEGGSIVIQKVK